MSRETKSLDLLKNPWTLSYNYCACIEDLPDALRTNLCEHSRTNTSKSTFGTLDALIRLCANVNGSRDSLIGFCSNVRELKCPVLCQRLGVESPRSVRSSTLRLQTLVWTFLRQTCVDQENKRRKDEFIECVQMSLRSLQFIDFHEGHLGLSSYPCG